MRKLDVVPVHFKRISPVLGLEPIVIEGVLEVRSGEVSTDMKGLELAVSTHGADSILCILTTTSCFAPREPDSLEFVSRLCGEKNIFHVVNNAYGLQESSCTHQILKGAQ